MIVRLRGSYCFYEATVQSISLSGPKLFIQLENNKEEENVGVLIKSRMLYDLSNNLENLSAIGEVFPVEYLIAYMGIEPISLIYHLCRCVLSTLVASLVLGCPFCYCAPRLCLFHLRMRADSSPYRLHAQLVDVDGVSFIASFLRYVAAKLYQRRERVRLGTDS